MLKEFREFIMKGNLIELATAFILGLAFAAVVTAFTGVVLDSIAYVLGGDVSFDQLAVHRDGQPVIFYGLFITALVQFVLIAFVLFLVVKAYNRFRKETPGVTPEEVLVLREIRDELKRR
ncbi:MAG: large conductance mechanosensitive channel protein MscL [Actinomycetota bacterium]